MLLEANPTPEQLKLLIVVLLILMGYHRDVIWSVMG
jgi:hypothetical protein